MRLGKDVISADLYAVLGVPRTATPKQIRRAYRLQAMTSHPDLHVEIDTQRMVDLNVAACVLLDPARRAAYDQARSPSPPSSATGPAPAPFYPWGSPTAEEPAWSPPAPKRERPLDAESRHQVARWRDGPGHTFAALAQWSDAWPPGTHLLVCFSAVCFATLLILSARPRSLPGFERNQPLACIADPALDG